MIIAVQITDAHLLMFPTNATKPNKLDNVLLLIELQALFQVKTN